MSELSFYDIWLKNKLPNNYFSLKISPLQGSGISVNGTLLPSLKPMKAHISLSENNVDWFPFFGSIKNANHFFTFFYHYFHIMDGQEAGIDFDMIEESISIYIKEFPDNGLKYFIILGKMYDLTPRTIIDRIKKIDNIREYPLIRHDDVYPENLSIGNTEETNWSYAGCRSYESFDYRLVGLIRQFYSRLYSHQVSKIMPLDSRVIKKQKESTEFYRLYY